MHGALRRVSCFGLADSEANLRVSSLCSADSQANQSDTRQQKQQMSEQAAQQRERCRAHLQQWSVSHMFRVCAFRLGPKLP